MTAEQAAMVEHLYNCRLTPASGGKRFIRDMHSKPTDYELSARQDWFLRRLYYHYRRQLGQPKMPKPIDYDDPPAVPSRKKTAQGEDDKPAPSLMSYKKAEELRKLQAWNEGRAL